MKGALRGTLWGIAMLDYVLATAMPNDYGLVVWQTYVLPFLGFDEIQEAAEGAPREFPDVPALPWSRYEGE